MRQVVICQFALFQHRVNMRQTGLWTVAHRNRDSTIQLHNWGRLNSRQVVIKRDNLRPISRRDRFGLRMNGCNRSLQRVAAEAAGVQRYLQQCHTFRDLLAVPERAVLVLQQNQLSGGRRSCGATRFVQQHQGKQPNDFRFNFLLWLEFGQQPAQSNRLAG